MKRLVAIFLCILFPVTAFAGDNSFKLAYDGGSINGVKAGTDMKLSIEGNQIRIVSGKGEVVLIPAAAVTEIRRASCRERV